MSQRIDNYTEPSSDILEAALRGNALVRFLNEITGVEWESREWENSGFHHCAYFGTISVSQGSYKHNLETFTLMNRGPGKFKGTGDPCLKSRTFKGQESLLANIKLTIIDMMEQRDKWNDAIDLNAGILDN